jgi:hypothetical protein
VQVFACQKTLQKLAKTLSNIYTDRNAYDCLLSKFGDRFLSAGRVRPDNQATTTILN